MRLDALPINAFDVLLLVVLLLGFARGRKHGMSEELTHVIQWACIVVGCAFIYEPAGKFLEGSSPLSLLTCYVLVYLAALLVIFGLFAIIRRSIGGKIIGSDVFGKSEYYLGMISGALRFSCVLIVGLALLNARYFSEREVRAQEKYQNDVYGSTFFPGLHSLQSTVFERSLTGPWIKDHLNLFLIKPTEPGDKALHQREFVMP